MDIRLMPWLIVWIVVTTAAVVLALYRRSHEIHGVHLGDDPAALDVQARRLRTVELWSKGLAVLSLLLLIAIVVMWAYRSWVETYGTLG